MTLEQLRIFVGVAERGHMTRAAEALGLTQSAVSAAIAALERRYDVRLFNRVGRGIELSQAGEILLPDALAMLRRAEAAVSALQDVAGLRRGRLVLAASQTVAAYWLPARMARFAQVHPGVNLRMITGNTAQVAEAVLAGLADLGYVEGEVDDAALARKVVDHDRVSLYAAPDHPLTRPGLRSRDLRRAVWVLREVGSGTRAHFEQMMADAGAGLQTLDIRLELPSNEAVLAAAESGGLVTAVSDLAAAPLVAAGRVVRLAFDAPQRAFALLTHRQRQPSRAAMAFIDA